MKKPVLVVMAAGMGSRYGGLKQIDPVGPNGEIIIDYSLYDAKQAGFETVIFIIKKEIEKDFKESVGDRVSKFINVKYAYQDISDLPEGFAVPEQRKKPWGTAHAILAARELIDSPFVAINADDFYGRDAFKVIYDHLSTHAEDEKDRYCRLGYELGKTVTDNGSVARGICETDDNGYLTVVTERTKIEKYEGGIHFTEDDGATWTDVPAETPVSMNMWGYTPSFLTEIDARFPAFLDATLSANSAKAEFFLPSTVSQLLNEEKATVKVLTTPDKWYGVTYAADKPVIVAALKEMTEKGMYPAAGLWSK